MTNSPGQARQPRRRDVQLAGEALLRLGMRLYRLELEALDSLIVPLSIRQYHILDRVAHHITSMTELAALAHRQPPTISRSVDSLVRQGLLARHTSPSDRRAATLTLTPAGVTVLDEARRARGVLALAVGKLFGTALDPNDLASIVDGFYEATESRVRSVADKPRGSGPNRAVRALP